MLYQVFRFFSKTHKLILIILGVALIFSCNQKSDNVTSKNSVKLETSLEEVLPQITLILPESEDENGQPVGVTVGSTYSGEYVPFNSLGASDRIRYDFFKQHVVEGNRYIFVVVAYNSGGSGTFHYLIAVDKTTLKSVHEVLLGDRVKTEKVSLTAANTDTVSITYMDREFGTAMAEPPDKAIEKQFKMDQGQLKEVSN